MGNANKGTKAPPVPTRMHKTYRPGTKAPQEYKNLPFPLKKIRIQQEIGRGKFGTVHFATALEIIESSACTDVAVKKLGDNPAIDNMRLEKELEVLKTLEPHDNVLKLYGWCIEERKVPSQRNNEDPDDDDTDDEGNSSGQRSAVKENPYYVYIVMEYMNKGSLLNYLRERRDERPLQVKAGDMLRFSYDVSLGMQHLAKYKIVHRNLGARNVMLSGTNPGDMRCKISDFVLALTLSHDTDTYYEKEKIPLDVRWLAPECLRGYFSIKTDVWAFGVVMWEIFSLGTRPYDDINSQFAVARDVQKGTLRLTCPSRHCEKKWHDKIMAPCWNKNPDKRPDFNRLEKKLSQALTEEKIYVEME